MSQTFVFLRIFLKDRLIGIKQFAQDQILIGNHQEASLELKDPSVAPFHSIIAKKEENTYNIVDLGSQNSTFKNGEKVLEAPLQSQDQLEIGPYRIEFFSGTQGILQTMHSTASASALSPTSPNPSPSQAPPSSASPPPASPLPQSSQLQTPSPVAPIQNQVTPNPTPVKPPSPSPPPPLEPEFKTKEKEEHLPAQAKEEFSAEIIKPIKQSLRTFAPPSAFKSAKEIIKPDKGTVVEVIVAWKERILKNYHFHKKASITIGYGEKADVQIPLLNIQKNQHTLIKFDSLATVYFTQEMTGDYTFKNQNVVPLSQLIQSQQAKKSFSGHKLTVHQGEMARIGLQNNLISIYIRYIPEIPPPSSGSFFPFSTPEMASLSLAAIIAVIFSFYIGTYTPKEKEKPPQKIKAVIQWKSKKKKTKKIEKKTIAKIANKKITKKPVEQAKPKNKKTPPSLRPQKKKMASKLIKRNQVKKQIKRPAKVAVVKKPIPPNNSRPKEVKRKDPSQLGLLSVLGSKGTQSTLNKIYSGSGNVNKAIKSKSARKSSSAPKTSSLFKTGLKSAHVGETSQLNTVGIGKVGVKDGRKDVYNTAFQSKGKTSFIDFKGQKATFSGNIDREGIRRVIRKNRGLIRACYNAALNRNENLNGKLVLQWDIEEDGTVSQTRVVKSDLTDSRMASCILNRLKLWQFPPPPRGQIGRITGYPFVFMSK